jgi:hypothetical protein
MSAENDRGAIDSDRARTLRVVDGVFSPVRGLDVGANALPKSDRTTVYVGVGKNEFPCGFAEVERNDCFLGNA